MRKRDLFRMILAGRLMDLAMKVAPKNTTDGVLVAVYVGAWSAMQSERYEQQLAAAKVVMGDSLQRTGR